MNSMRVNVTRRGKIYQYKFEIELIHKPLAEDFGKLLEVFNNENINEMVYEDNENTNENLQWRLKMHSKI